AGLYPLLICDKFCYVVTKGLKAALFDPLPGYDWDSRKYFFENRAFPRWPFGVASRFTAEGSVLLEGVGREARYQGEEGPCEETRRGRQESDSRRQENYGSHP